MSNRVTEFEQWIREPDYVEHASLSWFIDWVERRPLHLLASPQSSEDEVERVAKAVRRNLFVRTRRLSAFDETLPPTANELDDARAAIAAMSPRPQALGWQPIETAPKDETILLANFTNRCLLTASPRTAEGMRDDQR